MTTIDPSLYLNNQQQARTPSPDLGKEEFLKLLMVQLQNQDPTSPMEESEFMNQMATFSSLEQMMNMSNSIESLVNNQLISPVIQYSHMIGQEISYMTYDEGTGKEIGLEEGKVVAVSQNEGWAVFELENGEKIYADAVTQISEPNGNGQSPGAGEVSED